MSTPRHLPPKHGPFYKFVLRHSRTLHTYVSMLALLAITFFAVSGFMLNHPGWFGLDDSRSAESTLTIPANVLAAKDKLTLVEYLRAHGVSGAVQAFDWPGEGEPFHVSFKSPASEADVDITLPEGDTRLSIQTRGVAGLFTRLHTAKNAGATWSFLVDATAVFLVFVCVTGVVLWLGLPKRRSIGLAALVTSVIAVAAAYKFLVP